MESFLGVSIIIVIAWLFVGQPAVQLFLLCRQPRPKWVNTIALLGLFVHILFLIAFGYSTTFEGAYNFSGHGRYEEMPAYLFPSIFMLLVASILIFSIFILVVLRARYRS